MQSYKQSLKEYIRTLEGIKCERPVVTVELEALEDLYYKLDTHQEYLNESGTAYESQ